MMRSFKWTTGLSFVLTLVINLTLFQTSFGQKNLTSLPVLDSIYREIAVLRPAIQTKINEWEKNHDIRNGLAFSNADPFILVPIIKVSYNRQAPEIILSADSLLEICALSKHSELVYIYTPRSNDIARKGNTAALMRSSVLHSSEKSERLFFVYFFSIERYFTSEVGWFQNDNTLRLYSADKKAEYGIEDLLAAKYGAVDKYFQYVRQEDELNRTKRQALDEIERYEISKDWVLHATTFPKDTVHSTTLLLQHLHSTVGTTAKQEKKISGMIMGALKDPPEIKHPGPDSSLLMYYTYFGRSPVIMFKSIDLVPILSKVIGKKQTERFRHSTEIMDWQRKVMRSRLLKEERRSYKVDSIIRKRFTGN